MAKGKSRVQLLSIIISVAIVTIIMILGPAKAVTLGLMGLSDPTPTEGSSVTFTTYVDINTNERIPVENLILTIGTESCTFHPNGSEISGDLCADVTIAPNETGNYGYGYNWGYDSEAGSNHTFGYGYGYGNIGSSDKLSYTVEWTTPGVNSDTYYDVTLKANAGAHIYTKTFSNYIQVMNHDNGGNSGGGGGGSTSIIPPVEQPTETPPQSAEQNSWENEFSVGLGESGEFNIGEEQHSFLITEITENSVIFFVFSEPIEVTLNVGETKNVDLNGDKVNDLAVTLKGITQNKADLIFKDIAASKANDEATGPGITGAAIGGGKAGTFTIIAIVIVAVLVAALLVGRKARKKETK